MISFHSYRLKRLIGLLLASSISLLVLSSCRAKECRQMLACCEATRDIDGIGAACAGLAKETRDPTTCRTVIRTIGYHLDNKDVPLPQACQ